ncbi:MAG TPA: aldehyde dehydrogenase family protein, partial [Verrucomicrobiae bacterium]|nr:aldehyde dehydrogenase family protein [Verrucomicrobiae bacterium]
MALSSINPSSGEVLESFEETTPAALEDVLARAGHAFLGWRARTFAERAARLGEAARGLRAKKTEYARLMALEMGKPVTQGEAEVEKCAWCCEYYAEHAARFLAPEPRETDASQSYVRFDPLGPVLAIMPWNFPFWQVFRFAAPALMAGNAGILKHASNVPRCALEIERVFRAAGLPEGLFASVLVGSAKVAALIADPRIRAVTLTGSERAGSQVAERAGRELKKTVLELGGSDPFIVMPSADLEAAVKTAVTARVINNGQSCIAAKRFIVAD